MSRPRLSVSIEPSDSGNVHFLECAPRYAGGNETGHLNLEVTFTNTGRRAIQISMIGIEVVGTQTPGKNILTVLPALGPGGVVAWTQTSDYVFDISGARLSLKLKVSAVDYSEPAEFTFPLVPHESPTPQRSYRFWAAHWDLRPNEFWQVHGSSHGQSNPAQLYAYDVGVGVDDPTVPDYGHNNVLPGTDGRKNEDHRIWGKPIYAIADGTVTHFLNTFPTNPHPISDPNDFPIMFKDIYDQITALGHGNGNFFTIRTTDGSETVLYAHMQAGSLNPDLLSAGAPVEAGDFLGLAGNSGMSTAPHMHIHANRANADPTSWIDAPRPMPFHNAHAVAWQHLGANPATAPFVKLSGRGCPTDDCAVWPSDSRVTNLRELTVRHFTVSPEGQLWIVDAANAVRTASNRLPAYGVLLDVDPGGQGKELACHRDPYLIGMDQKIYRGLPTGWTAVISSPLCTRLTVDASTGKVWVVDTASRVFSYSEQSHRWDEHPGGGKAKDIVICNGVAHIIGLDDRIWRSAGQNGWQPMSGTGKAKRLAFDARAEKLWVIGMNDGIWSDVGNGNWLEHPGGGRGKEIFVHDGIPYIVGADDALWRSVGQSGWYRMNLVAPA
jgi:hypothetical protein